MQFDVVRKEAVILNPEKGMAPQVIPIEVRSDPLTGRTARVCHFQRLSWPKPDIAGIVAGTEAHCPFCPGRVHAATPCFPPEIAPAGRFTSGDRVLFPNLAPYDGLGAVAVLGGRHHVPMAEITAGFVAEGIALAQEFFRRVREIGHPESVYHLLSWNYMPASGSSIVHPHFQVFATASAPNQLRRELAAAAAYRERTGRVYWDDLVAAEEADGRRFLGRGGRVAWLAGFAPFGVAGDVAGVVAGCREVLDLAEEDRRAVGAGIAAAARAYDRLGLYNFNVGFFPGAPGDDFARLHLIFSPRTYFNPALATPDAAALRTLYDETVCMAPPEEIAALIRPEFAR
jgi:galactose-1-phosphate uridylyltransferase